MAGLFGQPAQQQQQQQRTSLFGQPAQQQQQPASTSLFGQPNQQQQPSQPISTGLFGQPNQPQQQPPPISTGLFGQPNQQPNQQQQQPQPISTGLFGQPTQQQQQQQQPPPLATGLFGQANQQQQQQQQQPLSTGLFGQPSQQQQQPQPASTGLFGQPNQQQTQPPASTGLFGLPAQQPQQNTLGTSLFGNPTTTNPSQSTNQPGQGLFASSPFGQQKSQQPLPTTQPAGTPFFTKTTKFNDLPDELKKIFENIDSHIQGRIQISKELKKRNLGEEATKGQELLRDVLKEHHNSASVVHSDLLFTQDLKAKADQAVQDTIVAIRIVDGFRNPQQNHTYLKDHSNFPLEFFSRVTVQMRERLRWYKSTIEQIERKLSSAASQVQYNPQAISSTLQAQHATFIKLASKTAALDAELQNIKALYTQLWRTKTGSVRDPFNDLDRNSGGDFGLESLQVT